MNEGRALRVAIFTDAFAPQVNGVVNTLNHLLATFREEGVECLVLAPGQPVAGRDRCNAWPVPFYPGLRLHLPDYRQIERSAAAFRPDLVHLVTEFGFGWTGRRFGLAHGIPLVSSFHTDFPFYLEKYGLPFLGPAGWTYLRCFHDAALRTYCPSRATLAKLTDHGFRRLELWGRGVDPVRPSSTEGVDAVRRRYGLAGKTVLLYVGRFGREKDLPVLLAALAVVNKEHRDSVHLLMVGDGPLRPKLEQLAPPNVSFTGYLTGDDLAAVYAAAEIFAFPSASETYGNAVLEAMSAGLPVVAPAAGGITENLVDGRNGLACRPGNVEEFASALARLIASAAYRQELGRNARDWAASRTWSKANGALIESYVQVVTSAGSRQRGGARPRVAARAALGRVSG